MEKRFYNNIGRKIKLLALITFLVEAIAAIFTGVVGFFILLVVGFFSGNMTMCLWSVPCLLVAVIGPIMAWVSTWTLYALGEIVDRLVSIDRNTRTSDQAPDMTDKHEADEREKHWKKEDTKRLAKERAEENQFRKRAMERTKKGFATFVEINNNGEVVCPCCKYYCGHQLGLQTCPQCGCIIKAVK